MEEFFGTELESTERLNIFEGRKSRGYDVHDVRYEENYLLDVSYKF